MTETTSLMRDSSHKGSPPAPYAQPDNRPTCERRTADAEMARVLGMAMNMLRDDRETVASIAAALGYSSQTAFAAAFRKLTGETPSDWRRRRRWQQSRCNRGNRSGAAANPVGYIITMSRAIDGDPR